MSPFKPGLIDLECHLLLNTHMSFELTYYYYPPNVACIHCQNASLWAQR